MAREIRGRAMAAASIILGILWMGFAIAALQLGQVSRPEAGRPYLSDTTGLSAACIMLTPVVITLGVGLAGVAFAQARRITALIGVAAALHVTLTVWIGILFTIVGRARAG